MLKCINQETLHFYFYARKRGHENTKTGSGTESRIQYRQRTHRKVTKHKFYLIDWL